jgi:signal transduction histidine kinase
LNIYLKKRRWKFLLFTAAIIIVGVSLWYTNTLVTKFAQSERTNVSIWASALQRKADLVNYADNFFEEIRKEEQKRAELLAETYRKIAIESNSNDITFYTNIILNNTTIPVILTNENDSIIGSMNIDYDKNSILFLDGELKKEFLIFDPIYTYYSSNEANILYYKESTIFTELRIVLDDLIETFFSEVVTNSVSVPVIVSDSSRQNIIAFGNIDSVKMQDKSFVEKKMRQMAEEIEPIQLQLPNSGTTYIFYQDSALLTQIRYYPFVQFTIVGLFFLIAYLLFSTARKSEQNQVWVGMSKETAHQLGTPLSSMMAWIELLKMKGIEDESVSEIEKDIHRLQNITERFSKIGSPPKLENENIIQIIYESIDYLNKRTSKKVKYIIQQNKKMEIIAPINKNLFGWVIENLCKNAIDAMSGVGQIEIDIQEEKQVIVIDISDTGKGITLPNFKTVFNPGFTSKQRGWGLGLSLSKRIIKDYHKGKIFVKSSIVGQGTTFRIVLNK